MDAAQAVGMIPVDLRDMGVDVYATSPHKWLQAPKGLGLAYVAPPVREVLRPMWVTWGQERWEGTGGVLEDYGTRNLAEVVTLGDAIAFHRRMSPRGRGERLESLWRHARNRVDHDPGLRWRSPDRWDLGSSIYAIEVHGRRSDRLARRMFEESGIVVRAFSTDDLNTVRLSPNVITTERELDRFFDLATG